jgi:surfeit locus 1 family protein
MAKRPRNQDKAAAKPAGTRAALPRALSAGSLLALTLLTATALVVLCGLGFWQLQRMGEKQAFLTRLAEQARSTPAPLPEPARWAGLDLDAADLTRVSLAGTWLPQSTATVRVALPEPKRGTRSVGGFGRYLVTAMRLDNGAVVLVNRGFAPEASVAALPAPTGRADLVGILRKSEKPNSFTPVANPATRDFHVRDPKGIAAALNLSAAPFLVEAERQPGALTLPVGTDIAELIARIPNNHLPYALTWFGLATTLAGVFIVFVRAGRRPRDG